MLFPFSMQQFLVAAAVLSLVWYAGVFLWFYQRRGVGLRVGVSGRAGRALARSGAAAPGFAANRLRPAVPGQRPGVLLGHEDFDELELMAKVKLPEGMELIASNELRFADPVDGAGSTGGQGLLDQDDQLGLIPDVLQEIKEVFGLLAKEDGTKRDFMELMRSVKERYPRISSHPGLAGLNSYIRDHASFHLSAQELEDLWD